MSSYIKVDELIQHLKANDLVLVKRSELVNHVEVDIKLVQAQALQKKALSPTEIVKCQLLPIRSRAGVFTWIKSGRIFEHEVYKKENGEVRILTSAIKRLRKEN